MSAVKAHHSKKLSTRQGNTSTAAETGGSSASTLTSRVKWEPRVSRFERIRIAVTDWYHAQNENDASLYIFPPDSGVRLAVWRIIRWPWFDRIVMLVIVLNCVFLAMMDPSMPATAGRNGVLNSAETAFTVIFTAELVLQIIARNFIFGPGAYLKSPWYWLDLLIVVSGVVDLLLSASGKTGTSGLTGLRTLRALRPLRTARALPGMRLMVHVMLEALPLLTSVAVLVVWLFSIFSIIGVQLFSGRLTSRCAYPVNVPLGSNTSALPAMASATSNMPSTVTAPTVSVASASADTVRSPRLSSTAAKGCGMSVRSGRHRQSRHHQH